MPCHSDIGARLEIPVRHEGVDDGDEDGNADRPVTLEVEPKEHADKGEQDDNGFLIAFGQHHHVAVVEDVLDDGGVDEHGGVVFFVGAWHEVEQGGRRGTEDEYLALVEPGIEAVLGDVVVGEVLECAVDVGRVVAALVVDQELAEPVDRDALHVAETQFLAGLELVDDGIGRCLDVADDLVRENDVVGEPLLGGLVVADVQVHGKVDGGVLGDARDGVAEEMHRVQDVGGDDGVLFFFLVVQQEPVFAFFVVLDRNLAAHVEFLVGTKAFQRARGQFQQRLGQPGRKDLAFENLEGVVVFLRPGDDDLGGNVNEFRLVGLDVLVFPQALVERKEHGIAESGIGRVVAAIVVPVYAERLAELDVLSHLDDHVFRLLVEYVQDRHERHGRVDARRYLGIEFRVREPVEQRHAAHDSVLVGVGVDGAYLGGGLCQFREDVVEQVLGLDVVGRVGLVEAECGFVA